DGQLLAAIAGTAGASPAPAPVARAACRGGCSADAGFDVAFIPRLKMGASLALSTLVMALQRAARSAFVQCGRAPLPALPPGNRCTPATRGSRPRRLPRGNTPAARARSSVEQADSQLFWRAPMGKASALCLCLSTGPSRDPTQRVPSIIAAEGGRFHR